MKYTKEMRAELQSLADDPAFEDDGYRLVDVPNVGEEIDFSFGSLFRGVPGTGWREYVDFGVGEVTFSGVYSEVIRDGAPIWYHHRGQSLTPFQLRLVLETAEKLAAMAAEQEGVKQPSDEKQKKTPSICLQCARLGNLCKVGTVGVSWCKHFKARDAEQYTADSEVGLDLDRAWMESMRKEEKGAKQ